MISNHMIIRRRLNASSASDGDDGEEDFLVLVLSFVIVICVVILYIRKLEFLIRGFLSGDVINGSFMKNVRVPEICTRNT